MELREAVFVLRIGEHFQVFLECCCVVGLACRLAPVVLISALYGRLVALLTESHVNLAHELVRKHRVEVLRLSSTQGWTLQLPARRTILKFARIQLLGVFGLLQIVDLHVLDALARAEHAIQLLSRTLIVGVGAFGVHAGKVSLDLLYQLLLDLILPLNSS